MGGASLCADNEQNIKTEIRKEDGHCIEGLQGIK